MSRVYDNTAYILKYKGSEVHRRGLDNRNEKGNVQVFKKLYGKSFYWPDVELVKSVFDIVVAVYDKSLEKFVEIE